MPDYEQNVNYKLQFDPPGYEEDQPINTSAVTYIWSATNSILNETNVPTVGIYWFQPAWTNRVKTITVEFYMPNGNYIGEITKQVRICDLPSNINLKVDGSVTSTLNMSCSDTGSMVISTNFSSTAADSLTFNWTYPANWTKSGSGSSITLTPDDITGGQIKLNLGASCNTNFSSSTIINVNRTDVPRTPTLSGVTNKCTIGSTFNVGTTVTNATHYTWEATGSIRIFHGGVNKTILITSTLSTVTIKATGTGEGTIRVKGLNLNCYPGVILTGPEMSETMWVGTPNSANLDMAVYQSSNPNQLCVDQQNLIAATYNESADPDPAVTGFVWTLSDPNIITGYFDNVTRFGYDDQGVAVEPYSGYSGSVDATVKAVNNCGNSAGRTETFTVVYCGGYFLSVSPNPNPGDEIDVKFKKDKKDKNNDVNEDNPIHVSVYNFTQEILYNEVKFTDEFSIDSKNLNNGTYIVKCKFKKKEYYNRVLINR